MQQTRHLWRCMLKLQRRYACYNSTRIDLAVNAGNAGVELMRKWSRFRMCRRGGRVNFRRMSLSPCKDAVCALAQHPGKAAGLQRGGARPGFRNCKSGIFLLTNTATPFIIDTLNDSLVDLPDEGWQMLDRCLQPRKAIGKT